MRVYISKTANTFTGIYDTLAPNTANPATDTIEASNFGGAVQKFRPGEWHTTEAEAIIAALSRGQKITQYAYNYHQLT